MNIRTLEGLATAGALAMIALIGVTVGVTYGELASARRQAHQADTISRKLNELRLLTFEYRLDRLERARIQWRAVSSRLDRLIADSHSMQTAEREILDAMAARRVKVRGLFEELALDRLGPARDESRQRFESQLASRLLTLQQETFDDVHRLIELANVRIDNAQRRMIILIGGGLAALTLIQLGAAWLLRQHVVAPIVRLEAAARRVAGGDWDTRLDFERDDEIGQLADSVNAMRNSLRDGYQQIQHQNHELAMVNTELEAFSYSVSHDLRSPLRSMDGFAQILLEDYADRLDDEGRDSLQRIRAASQRMGHLIDDLLRLSRITRAELKRASVDLGAIAGDIAAEVDREQPGRIQWVIEDGLVTEGDAALLRIALQNLLGNAVKFTGKVEQPLIHIGREPESTPGIDRFFVSDNGVGFDMAHADRLFGAFQRLHDTASFPGTGIGLAIVQRILRRHDGDIHAESAKDAGATFHFTVKRSNNE